MQNKNAFQDAYRPLVDHMPESASWGRGVGGDPQKNKNSKSKKKSPQKNLKKKMKKKMNKEKFFGEGVVATPPDQTPQTTHPPDQIPSRTTPPTTPLWTRHPPGPDTHPPGTEYTPLGLSTPPGTKYTPRD